MQRDAGRFPGGEKPDAHRHRDLERRPSAGRALVTVRLSLASPEYRPTLKIEVQGDGAWEEIYSGTFRPFNSFVSVYNLQMPIAWKTSPPRRMRFTVGETGRKGILYAWISLHDRTLRLRSSAEIAGETEDPESVLIDSDGTGIHGIPNSLRKASEGTSEDVAVIEMVLA